MWMDCVIKVISIEIASVLVGVIKFFYLLLRIEFDELW